VFSQPPLVVLLVLESSWLTASEMAVLTPLFNSLTRLSTPDVATDNTPCRTSVMIVSSQPVPASTALAAIAPTAQSMRHEILPDRDC